MKFWPFNKKKKEIPNKRAYAGAAFGRLVSDWVATSSSIDTEIRGSIIALRNRARQLGRDNDYVRAFLRALQNNVVGTGIDFQSHINGPDGTSNPILNKKIETEWKKWCKKNSCHAAGKLNFADIERLCIRSVGESGEIFIRLVKNKFGNSNVPLGIQIFEGDQICENQNGLSELGNEIRMGIEQDEWGRAVAYYVKPHHPGDYQFTQKYISSAKLIRIPADEMIHLYVHERPGQARGVTWLASSIMRLHQMAGYEEGEVISARATASLMGFIESPEGETPTDGIEDGERVTDFQPGTFKYLGPGEKVNVPDLKRPGGQFDPFIRSMLRGVAAGIGASYETVSSDYSQSNYSSTRQSLIGERDNWKVIQAWMLENFHQVVFDAWLDQAVLSGVIKIPDYEMNTDKYQAVQWMPRGWQWIDPLKDVNASKEAIKAGLDSISNVLAQSGQDFEAVMLQRKREKDFAESLGLTFDVDEPQIANQANNPNGTQLNNDNEDSADNADGDGETNANTENA